MSRNRFVAARITTADAMDLWGRSDDGTAFTRPDYLAHLVDEVEWWGVDRSGEIVAAWPLVRAVTGGEIGPPPFCYYVGPMFANSLRDATKYHRYWTAFTGAFADLVDAVAAEYPRFRFSLPPGFNDVRVLQWWNFDNQDRVGFGVSPRHTARIDLRSIADEAALRRSFARDRRRSVDRWSADPPAVADHVETDRLIELHDQALARNGGVIDPIRHIVLRRLVDLVNSGAGSIIGWIPRDAEQVEAVIVLLDGAQEANNVLCAAGDPWRSAGLKTWAIWQGILRSRFLGKHWFDFNGANSPARAADKHYYSAEAALYFDCSFGTP